MISQTLSLCCGLRWLLFALVVMLLLLLLVVGVHSPTATVAMAFLFGSGLCGSFHCHGGASAAALADGLLDFPVDLGISGIFTKDVVMERLPSTRSLSSCTSSDFLIPQRLPSKWSLLEGTCSTIAHYFDSLFEAAMLDGQTFSSRPDGDRASAQPETGMVSLLPTKNAKGIRNCSGAARCLEHLLHNSVRRPIGNVSAWSPASTISLMRNHP